MELQRLRLVKEVSNLFENLKLDKTLIIACQHILKTNYQMFLSLFDKGLVPENTYILGKCYSTDNKGLQMFVIYTLPNGSQTFFIAFEVKEGRYGSFLFANWTGLDADVNTTQTFTIMIFTLPGKYGSGSAYMTFYYDPAPAEPPPPPQPNFFTIMMLQIAVFSIAMLLVLMGYFLNQYRRQRRMRTSEIDEQTMQDIENTLNTIHAIIRELEWTLTDRRIDRLEMLRLASGESADRLEAMLKRLRELAKETGV